MIRVVRTATGDDGVIAPKTRRTVARIGVGVALVLGVLYQFVTFYPGAEARFHGTAAAAAALGLLSPGWPMRLAAIVLGVVFASAARDGYHRGLEYERWRREVWLPRVQQEREPERQAQPPAAPDRGPGGDS